MAVNKNVDIYSNTPELYWPVCGYNYDGRLTINANIRCPDYSELKQSWHLTPKFKDMKDSEPEDFPQAGFSRFWEGLAKAENAYILDSYFTDDNLDKVLVRELIRLRESATREALNLVIFSSGSNLGKRASSMEQSLRSRKIDNCTIKIYPFDDAILHDRFALLDRDLWHFGVSIGGFYGGLHVISGPWPDRQDFHTLCKQLHREAIKNEEATNERPSKKRKKH